MRILKSKAEYKKEVRKYTFSWQPLLKRIISVAPQNKYENKWYERHVVDDEITLLIVYVQIRKLAQD